MSVLQSSDSINSQDLQIWNNAAFDNGESEDSTAVQVSWSSIPPAYVNRSESFESDTSKENLGPLMAKTPVSVKNSIPFTPLHPNDATAIVQGKPLKVVGFKKGFLEPSSTVKNSKKVDGRVSVESKIDTEIEEIEKEISRLSTKLEALRTEKAEQVAHQQGRFFPSKIVAKNVNEAPLSRRGFSLCPSEILARDKSRELGKPQWTPIPSTQSRRKSCFWKIHEIDELKMTKERRMTMTVSPKQRKAIPKIQPATTIVSKRPAKREDGVISLIQPKKLFNDGEKSAPAKKPVKLGRVVASRYNQVSLNEVRKRSLSEDGKEDGKRADKRRASVETGQTPATEGRVKKKWEFPVDVLPKIRTVRCVNESPRDSGPAKRVADLVGRRSYFGDEDEMVLPI